MTQKELETKIAKKTIEIEKLEKARSVYVKLRNSIPDIIKSYSMKEQVIDCGIYGYKYGMTDNNVSQASKDISELVIDELINVFNLKEDN